MQESGASFEEIKGVVDSFLEDNGITPPSQRGPDGPGGVRMMIPGKKKHSNRRHLQNPTAATAGQTEYRKQRNGYTAGDTVYSDTADDTVWDYRAAWKRKKTAACGKGGKKAGNLVTMEHDNLALKGKGTSSGLLRHHLTGMRGAFLVTRGTFWGWGALLAMRGTSLAMRGTFWWCGALF